jgi:hypothetical protein
VKVQICLFEKTMAFGTQLDEEKDEQTGDASTQGTGLVDHFR